MRPLPPRSYPAGSTTVGLASSGSDLGSAFPSSPGAAKGRRLTFVPVTDIRTVDETACGWLSELARGGCSGTLPRRRVLVRLDLTSLPPGVRSVKPELARGVRYAPEGTARHAASAHPGLVTTSLDAPPPAPIGNVVESRLETRLGMRYS